MVHQLVMRYERVVFTKILHWSDINEIVYVLITLPLVIITSVVVDRYILKPVTQWLTKRIRPSMTVRS